MANLRKCVSGNCGVFFLYFLISVLSVAKGLYEGHLLAPANDALQYNFPTRQFLANSLKSFDFPLWNPYMFTGMPFVALMQTGALYPLNIIMYFALPAKTAFNLSYIIHISMVSFFTCLLARQSGVRGIPAFLAGLIFAFTGFFEHTRDHTAILNSSAYMPLVLMLLLRLRESPDLRRSMHLSIAVVLQLLAGNFQICFYTYMVSGLCILFWLAADRKVSGRSFLLYSALGFLAGFAMSSPQIISNLGLLADSWMGHTKTYRGYEYFSLYHTYKFMLPTLVLPNALNGIAIDKSVTFDTGTVAFVLSLCSVWVMFGRDGRVMLWGLVAVLGIVLSLGHEIEALNRVLYHVPIYNMIRAHGRNTMEFTLALSMLSAIGLDEMLYNGRGLARKYKTTLIRVSAGLIIITAISIAALKHADMRSMAAYLAAKGSANPMALAGIGPSSSAVYIPAGLMALTAGLGFAAIRMRADIVKYMMAALIVLDILNASGGFGGFSNGPAFNDNLCETEPYYEYLDKGEHFRVATIFRKDDTRFNPMSQQTCGVGGVTSYDLYLSKAYTDMLNLYFSGRSSEHWQQNLQNNVIISMLGAKYITVSNDYPTDIDGIRASDSIPASENVNLPSLWDVNELPPAVDGTYTLGGATSGNASSVFSILRLEPGYYELALKSRSAQGAQKAVTGVLSTFMGMRSARALLLIPDYIGAGFKEFRSVFHVPKDDFYHLSFSSNSGTPIEIREIELRRINGFAPPAMPDSMEPGRPVYTKLKQTGLYALYRNENAMPRAWSVAGLVGSDSPEQTIGMLQSIRVNPAREAIVGAEDLEAISRASFTQGEVRIDKYTNNSVELDARFDGEGFVVLADTYDKDWRAFVNGRETPIYRTDGILRGVVVPPGANKVVFVYRPARLFVSLLVSAAIALAILLYLARRKDGGLAEGA